MISRYMIRVATLVLVVGLPITWLGCGDDDNGPIEPVEDPGEQMIAQTVIIGGAVGSQLNEVRNPLNAAQAQLQPFNPQSTNAGDVIQGLVEFSDNKVWAAGLVNTSGVIENIFPSELDTLVGYDWSDLNSIQVSLQNGGLASGDVRVLGNTPSVLYARSVGMPEDDEGVQGIVFSAIDVDRLFEQALTFTRLDTIENSSFFALNDDGEIIYTQELGWFGINITDPLQVSEAVVDLAERMINTDETEGSDIYSADNAPGGSGMRVIGWIQMPLLNDRFWVMAATVPDEAEES